MDIHCSPEGDWNSLPKESFARYCKVRINPNDVLTSGSPSIASFIDYISPFLIPAEIETLLESSDVVGNIRFSHPTLYVFPGGQGDAALFGINGFNMLLDGGFSRKSCFWDFVRHLDRLDAVLLTRLNNSNVNGISAVLRRKRQNAVYPQIGHFFCNIPDKKAVLSPDGDKDKDPLLVNILEEGHEIISNLQHLSLTPQSCYRDSEPINLYHKVGHGTLDMYVLSPAKDSREVREFIHKWNNNDQKLFAYPKNNKDFTFPVPNLVSICALLVWQPANPEDNITRILYPGSTPQHKIFEGLDKIKHLGFIKHPVCSESSLTPSMSATALKAKSIIDRIVPEQKPSKRIFENKQKEKLTKDSDIKTKLENKIIENGDTTESVEKQIKKSESTEGDKIATKVQKPKKLDTEKEVIEKTEDKQKTKKDETKAKVDIKLKQRSESQQRKPKPPEKKASPTTPKKTIDSKLNGETPKPKPAGKASPQATPAKSAKEANNRRVVESKYKQTAKPPTKPVPEKKEVKERKPVTRKAKEAPATKPPSSPLKKVNGVTKGEAVTRKARLDKEGTTDSSTVSTPSADQESMLKKDISKLTPEEIEKLKAQELADLKEEQEVVKEIEAVFRKGEIVKDKFSDMRKIKDLSVEEKEKEEYLIIEKEELVHETVVVHEDEIQKLTRDSEESEKQKPLEKETEVKVKHDDQKAKETTTEVAKTITSKEGSVASPEDKVDTSSERKTNERDVEEYNKESQPDEKVSGNVESGATTTAPTLPEDERIPLDEIKEDNNDQAVEEKHVKEETKEKEVPVIQLPPKAFEAIVKLPPVVGIRLDKHSNIRDLVKTPDEVADLPVHEEVDIHHYEEYRAVESAKESAQYDKYDEKIEQKEEKTETKVDTNIIASLKQDEQLKDKENDGTTINIQEAESKKVQELDDKVEKIEEIKTVEKVRDTVRKDEPKKEDLNIKKPEESILEAELVVKEIQAAEVEQEKTLDFVNKDLAKEEPKKDFNETVDNVQNMEKPEEPVLDVNLVPKEVQASKVEQEKLLEFAKELAEDEVKQTEKPVTKDQSKEVVEETKEVKTIDKIQELTLTEESKQPVEKLPVHDAKDILEKIEKKTTEETKIKDLLQDVPTKQEPEVATKVETSQEILKVETKDTKEKVVSQDDFKEITEDKEQPYAKSIGEKDDKTELKHKESEIEKQENTDEKIQETTVKETEKTDIVDITKEGKDKVIQGSDKAADLAKHLDDVVKTEEAKVDEKVIKEIAQQKDEELKREETIKKPLDKEESKDDKSKEKEAEKVSEIITNEDTPLAKSEIQETCELVKKEDSKLPMQEVIHTNVEEEAAELESYKVNKHHENVLSKPETKDESDFITKEDEKVIKSVTEKVDTKSEVEKAKEKQEEILPKGDIQEKIESDKKADKEITQQDVIKLDTEKISIKSEIDNEAKSLSKKEKTEFERHEIEEKNKEKIKEEEIISISKAVADQSTISVKVVDETFTPETSKQDEKDKQFTRLDGAAETTEKEHAEHDVTFKEEKEKAAKDAKTEVVVEVKRDIIKAEGIEKVVIEEQPELDNETSRKESLKDAVLDNKFEETKNISESTSELIKEAAREFLPEKADLEKEKNLADLKITKIKPDELKDTPAQAVKSKDEAEKSFEEPIITPKENLKMETTSTDKKKEDELIEKLNTHLISSSESKAQIEFVSEQKAEREAADKEKEVTKPDLTLASEIQHLENDAKSKMEKVDEKKQPIEQDFPKKADDISKKQVLEITDKAESEKELKSLEAEKESKDISSVEAAKTSEDEEHKKIPESKDIAVEKTKPSSQILDIKEVIDEKQSFEKDGKKTEKEDTDKKLDKEPTDLISATEPEFDHTRDTVVSEPVKDVPTAVHDTSDSTLKQDEKLISVRQDAQQVAQVDKKLQELKCKISETPDVSATEIKVAAEEIKDIPVLKSVELIEKIDLGSKSPKEREQDVAKIVATVAEVLKSDAPLEELEEKVILPSISSFGAFTTTQLRETHITTQDGAPSDITKEADGQKVTEEPVVLDNKISATSAFLEQERKIITDTTVTERSTSLIQDSEDLMQETSKIIADIKSGKAVSVEGASLEKSESTDSSATVHRMLVTASSEDGGEETVICPAGSITFSRSSESSGRSSPDIQSDSMSTVKTSIDMKVFDGDAKKITPPTSGIEKDNMKDNDLRSEITTPESKSEQQMQSEDVADKKSGANKVTVLQEGRDKSEEQLEVGSKQDTQSSEGTLIKEVEETAKLVKTEEKKVEDQEQIKINASLDADTNAQKKDLDKAKEEQQKQDVSDADKHDTTKHQEKVERESALSSDVFVEQPFSENQTHPSTTEKTAETKVEKSDVKSEITDKNEQQLKNGGDFDIYVEKKISQDITVIEEEAEHDQIVESKEVREFSPILRSHQEEKAERADGISEKAKESTEKPKPTEADSIHGTSQIELQKENEVKTERKDDSLDALQSINKNEELVEKTDSKPIDIPPKKDEVNGSEDLTVSKTTTVQDPEKIQAQLCDQDDEKGKTKLIESLLTDSKAKSDEALTKIEEKQQIAEAVVHDLHDVDEKERKEEVRKIHMEKPSEQSQAKVDISVKDHIETETGKSVEHTDTSKDLLAETIGSGTLHKKDQTDDAKEGEKADAASVEMKIEEKKVEELNLPDKPESIKDLTDKKQKEGKEIKKEWETFIEEKVSAVNESETITIDVVKAVNIQSKVEEKTEVLSSTADEEKVSKLDEAQSIPATVKSETSTQKQEKEAVKIEDLSAASDLSDSAGPSRRKDSLTSHLSPSKTSIEDLNLSGKSTPDIADVERMREMQEILKHEKHIPGSCTPPTVPVSPVVKDEGEQLSSVSESAKADVKKSTETSPLPSLKDAEVRSITPASDDYDISSGQASRAAQMLETERNDSEEDFPGSPNSITSQLAHSHSTLQYEFEESVKLQGSVDPMNLSFYGALPDDPILPPKPGDRFLDEADMDFEKAVHEHRQTRGEDLGYEASSSYLFEVTKAKYGSSGPSSLQEELEQKKIDSLMTSSFIGDLPSGDQSEVDVEETLKKWGKPLGLPSPAPPNDNKGTPKKERKLPPYVTAKNKINDDRKRAESPSKNKQRKSNAVYVDLTYVPHHGNSNYSYVDFFKRVRARYYVFSGIEPSKEVYNALLEAKQTWEDKDLGKIRLVSDGIFNYMSFCRGNDNTYV